MDRGIFTDDDFLGSYVTDRPGPTASGEIDNPTVVTNSAVPTVGEMGNPTAHCHNEVGNIEELEMRPSTSVGMSTPVHFTADGNQNVVSVIITPEQLQPFPKATARKTNRQGRKLGRSKIATDTPEKIEIRKGKTKHNMKTAMTNVGLKPAQQKSRRMKRRPKAVKKIHYDSESDSEDWPIEDDDDNEAEIFDIFNQEISEARDEQDFERPTFENRDFVLVGLTKKKGPTEYYVAQIVSKDLCGVEFQMKFFKRIGSTSKFMCESHELFDVNEEDILVKLPKPIECTGSARVTGQLWFQVDFDNYNVK